ncbi:MAG: nucleotidyltransferase family protein [Planctomycetes bacterium]|jgi:predicted nucleotidyltransferase|nr:nucleotidyltransferase family protein [Planctomycetota bacterium]MCX6036827.1 nucleotidyltransferase family protein [Chloroflexota bacterium]MDP2993912.1 nucleotidyltransferase family protein [Anaerolineales bacterium]
MNKQHIIIPRKKIGEFCRRWKVAEFSLFGSVLREDFRPDSDVDVLVTFAPDAKVSLFDLVEMQDELKAIFKREVDLVEKQAIIESQNYIRRKNILGNTRVVYAQG